MARRRNLHDDPKLPKPQEVLIKDQADVPRWLEGFKPNSPFPRRDFFCSRVVYHPGCGGDGHPLRIWGKSHSAHCFVFVDYGVEFETISAKLTNPDAPRRVLGYRTIHFAELRQDEITPQGWRPHIAVRPRYSFANVSPFAVWAVLERLDDFGEDHGPHRICILHICGDGFATFDALFCQGHGSGVHGVLLQDHGFGGDWGSFGQNGYLFQLAARFAKPKWLLVANNTEAWAGYRRRSSSEIGGANHHERFLDELQDEVEMMTALENIDHTRRFDI